MIFLNNLTNVKLTGNELKKYRQKKKILHLLYKYDSLSGSSIGRRIGVSLPTAILLISELTELKFVESCGTGVSKGGRRPNMFRLANESVYVVACELGRYRGKVTIYNSHNQAVTPITYFETSINDDNLVEKIYTNSQELIRKSKIDNQRVFGIGLTMPGLVDEKTGINNTIVNSDYQNVKKHLEDKFGKFVYVNNDARMQAFGEFIFGKAKGHENALIVNWNWGIGIGMILDGKLYNGSTGFAGELSHAKFVENGKLCICGKRGCLETIASANVLVEYAIKGIEDGKVSQLTKRFKNKLKEITPEDIIKSAKMGDEFSISLLNKIGLALGQGLSFSIQLLNPDIIVLGGIISNARQFVLTPIHQSLNKYCLEQISSNVKIVNSENWEQSGLLGITAMLYQKIFSDMIT